MRDVNQYLSSLAKSSSICGTRPSVGTSVFDDKLYLWNARRQCGRWECPHCGKVKERKLRKRVNDGFQQEHTRLLTLTCSTKDYDVQKSITTLSRDWDIFCKRLRRRYPKLKFFKIIEFHRNRRAHLHILVNVFIPQEYISKAWREIHHSPIVWINPVDSVNAVAYVTKYITKGMQNEDGTAAMFYIFSRRRFSFSQNFLPVTRADIKKIFLRNGTFAEAKAMYDLICKELLSTYKFIGETEDGLCSVFETAEPPP